MIYRIPLGGHSTEEARQTAHRWHPRRQNWETPRAADIPEALVIRERDNGRYSRRCFWHHIVYPILVRSIATIDGKSLHFSYGDDPDRIVIAPRGYRWGTDQHGIRLFKGSNPSDDYHPDSDDLRTLTGYAIARKLRENERTRKESLAKLRQQKGAIRRAEREGARVCLADSVRAGNCLVGTTSWARQHKLDPARHYRPSKLLALANGDMARVSIVCAVALRRHNAEMARGYSILAEHKIGGEHA